jgi:predicted MFS family arabinose efflux permease
MMTEFENSNSTHCWYFAIAGLCSLFIGLGLCRFCYTPIIPALINQHWVTESGASYLGTINFFGYFLGAFLGQRVNKYLEIPTVIKINLITSIIGLALCAINLGFVWLALWRFIVGITGAMLMVLTPSTILKKVPVNVRGRVSGMMFTGIGIGIILSGIFFPFLAKTSIMSAWLAAALLCSVATMIAWPAFSKKHYLKITQPREQTTIDRSHLFIIILLVIAYSLFAIGQIPHTLFLVDYVHRKLELSLITSGMFWTVFGIGSLMGPFIAGFIADKVGVYKALLSAFLACFLGITIIVFNKILILYLLSSFLMGFLLPSIVALTSSRLIELVGTECHPNFWGKMTLYYAISQVVGAYGMSYLLRRGFNYTDCFVIAGVAFLIGLIIILFTKAPRLPSPKISS